MNTLQAPPGKRSGRTQPAGLGAEHPPLAAACGNSGKLARSRLRGGGRAKVLDTFVLVHGSYLRWVYTKHVRA